MVWDILTQSLMQLSVSNHLRGRIMGVWVFAIGTALFVEPDAPVKIVAGLKDYLKRKQLKSVTELVGKVRKY